MRKLPKTVAALIGMPARAAPSPRAGPPKLSETAGFGANPGGLRMLHYRPDILPEGAPLVVVLHGCTQTAEGYAAGAGWLGLADRYGFAVLCPEQTQANNPNGCFNWFHPGDTGRGVGEVESIRQMIAKALADHALDPGRVFVTGLSAGGAMTSAMLATHPEIFAGGAIVAGLPYGAASNVQEAFGAMYQGSEREASVWGDRVRAASYHRGPWPKVSIWHGDGDSTVRPGNADSVALQWADVQGLGSTPSETQSVNGHSRRIWRNAAGEALIESYTIRGMGHGTPLHSGGEDGYGVAGPFLLEAGISSSLLIAGFWGVADLPAAAAPAVLATIPADAAPAPESAPADAWTDARGWGGTAAGFGTARFPLPGAASADPAQVIANALRAAGLLK